MARDWAAVADAMKARLTDLDMTQADLVQRSRLAPMTIRELLYNSAQRRRSDQTLAALSQALGWPPGYLQAVAEGRTPERPRCRRSGAGRAGRDEGCAYRAHFPD